MKYTIHDDEGRAYAVEQYNRNDLSPDEFVAWKRAIEAYDRKKRRIKQEQQDAQQREAQERQARNARGNAFYQSMLDESDDDGSGF